MPYSLLRCHTFLALLLCIALGIIATTGQAEPASHPELALQIGHSNWVLAIAFSPDGKQCASGSRDTTIKVWDLESGRLLRTLTGHNNEVTSVAFSRDGKQLASGSDDQTTKVWDIRSGRLLHTLTGHSDSVTSVAFSPHGKQLASGSWDGTIKVWDASSGQLLRTLSGHSRGVASVVFSPNGKQLASGGYDHAIKLWDVSSGKMLHTLSGQDTGHHDGLDSVAFSPDGKQLVSGSRDTTIKVWGLASGKLLRTIGGHSKGMVSVAFSPDGRRLASGYQDSTIKVWDTANGKLLHTFEDHIQPVTSVEFTPDGKQLASGSVDCTIKIWDVAHDKLLHTFNGKSESIYSQWNQSVAFSGDGKYLAGNSEDNTIKIWDVKNGKLSHIIREPKGWVTSVAFSPDGTRLAGGNVDRTVKIWDVASGQLQHTLSEHSRSVTSVAFSPDGKYLASGSTDSTIKIWDVESGQMLRSFGQHYVLSVAFSPDGKQLASGSDNNIVQVWDVDSGQLQHTFTAPYTEYRNGVFSVAFSPDGKYLACGSADCTVKVWDLATGERRLTLSGHDHDVNSVAFSPDGKYLASGSNDSTIKVWDAAGGKLLRTLSGHNGAVDSLMFSEDGRQLASGNRDGTTKLWGTESGRCLVTLLPLPEAGEDIQARAKGLPILNGKEASPLSGEWFITTSEGYFDCSANASRYILWNVNGTLCAAESYYRKFRRPNLVQRALRGEALPPVQFTNDDVPPTAQFLSVRYQGPTQKPSRTQPVFITVTVEARGRHDFLRNAVQLLVNNRPLPPEHEHPLQVKAVPIEVSAQALQTNTKAPISLGDKAISLGDKAISLGDKPAMAARSTPTPYKFAKRFTFRVPMPLGDENVQVRAVAYDSQDLGSTPGTIWLRNRQVQPVKGNLYALCVGLSHYGNGMDLKPGQKPLPGKIPNLQYPDDDARQMAQRLRQEARGYYGQVEVHTLLDEQVTLQKVRGELKWLQQKVRPGQIDTVVVFLSGHGLSNERGEFFFPTHEFDPSSTQSQSSTSLSGAELQRELGSALRARTVFLFVDSCHSGALSSQAGAERGAATGDDLSFAVKESGVYLLASSGALQTSLESNAWGHGVFTQALLDSLHDASHARRGLIYFDVLTYLVPGQVSKLLREAKLSENAMAPVVPLEGRYLDEPVVRVRP